MILLGIDPGLTGALAWIYADANGLPIVRALEDMPVVARSRGKGNQVDAAALARLLRAEPADLTLVEEIWGLPPLRASRTGAPVRAGTTSTFSFGESCGVIRGVLAALDRPVQYVPPQTWRTKAGLTGQGKDASRGVAARLHPEAAGRLTRSTKDHGRADAILIARAGLPFARSAGVDGLM